MVFLFLIARTLTTVVIRKSRCIAHIVCLSTELENHKSTLDTMRMDCKQTGQCIPRVLLQFWEERVCCAPKTRQRKTPTHRCLKVPLHQGRVSIPAFCLHCVLYWTLSNVSLIWFFTLTMKNLGYSVINLKMLWNYLFPHLLNVEYLSLSNCRVYINLQTLVLEQTKRQRMGQRQRLTY